MVRDVAPSRPFFVVLRFEGFLDAWQRSLGLLNKNFERHFLVADQHRFVGDGAVFALNLHDRAAFVVHCEYPLSMFKPNCTTRICNCAQLAAPVGHPIDNLPISALHPPPQLCRSMIATLNYQ